MALCSLQLETRQQKFIRMGITIFKSFICGGISSDIRKKFSFTATHNSYPLNIGLNLIFLGYYKVPPAGTCSVAKYIRNLSRLKIYFKQIKMELFFGN